MENSSPIICAISVIFTKLPEGNSRPIGENSPNLVTLGRKSIILCKNGQNFGTFWSFSETFLVTLE
jgi:hypothetical protein